MFASARIPQNDPSLFEWTLAFSPSKRAGGEAGKLVTNYLNRGGGTLAEIVEVGGEEYRVVIQPRKKRPVLHERW